MSAGANSSWLEVLTLNTRATSESAPFLKSNTVWSIPSAPNLTKVSNVKLPVPNPKSGWVVYPT